MSRLPNVGADDDAWGDILNDFLQVSHNTDGTLKSTSLPNASTSSKGVVQLAIANDVNTGTSSTVAVTPASLTNVLQTVSTHTGQISGLSDQAAAVALKIPSSGAAGSVLTKPSTDSASNVWQALPTASTTGSGLVELATTAEAATGTDTTLAVTPAGLKTVADTKVTNSGGISAVKSVTAAPNPQDQVAGTLYVVQNGSSGAATDSSAGTVQLATPTEALAGTNTTKAVTPAGVKAVADTKAALSHTHTSADLPSATTSGTGIVELATTAETAAGTDTTRAVTPSGLNGAMIAGVLPVTLTDAATIATNAALSNYFRVTITSSRTLGIPTNPTDGQRVLWEVTASGGSRVLTLTTGSTGAFKFGTDFTVVPSIASGTTTFIGAVYRSTSSRWHVISVGSGH